MSIEVFDFQFHIIRAATYVNISSVTLKSMPILKIRDWVIQCWQYNKIFKLTFSQTFTLRSYYFNNYFIYRAYGANRVIHTISGFKIWTGRWCWFLSVLAIQEYIREGRENWVKVSTLIILLWIIVFVNSISTWYWEKWTLVQRITKYLTLRNDYSGGDNTKGIVVWNIEC